MPPGPLEFGVRDLPADEPMLVRRSVPAAVFSGCLEGEGAFAAPVDVELELRACGEEILCRGRVSGEWTLECTRCLAPLRCAFQARFDAALQAIDGRADASEDVRQALILAIPSLRYCRQDCKGLCPQCRTNLNEKDCGCASAVLSGRFKTTKRGNHHA